MRIAHFVRGRCSPDSANGVDKTAYHLSRAQSAAGDDVAVYSLTTKEPIPIGDAAVVHFPPTGSAWRLPPQLVAHMVAWRPDVLHLHSAFVPENVRLAAALARQGVPYVVTPNGVLSPRLLRRRRVLKVPFRYLVERPYLGRALLLHAVSPNEIEEFRGYRIRTPIVEAPNGFDPASVPEGLRRGVLRERFPAIGKRRIALFIGRLDILQKGLDLLLDAARRIAGDERAPALVLVGPDWLDGRRRIEQWISEGGLADRVFLAEPAFGDLKFEYLADADFFVHVSRWEGLPFAVLEAMACGAPALITEATNLADHVRRYGGGRVVAAEPGAIAAELLALGSIGDVELSEMTDGAKRLVAQEFDWSRIAATIVSAIREALP